MRALKRWLSLDWLFPPPRPEEVALRLEAALRARGIESLQADLPRGQVTGEHEGRSFHLNFANVYRDCLRVPRRQRYAVIQQVAQHVASGDAAVVPARYETARARLMPVVRPTAELTAAVLSTGMPSMQAGPAHRPDAADLSVALVCDSPSAMSYVSWQQLADWEMDFDTALGDALHNLRGLPEKQRRSADYRRQKDLIERLHATHGLHAPVSAYQCFDLGNGEPPMSCAMWVPDMEFLLPAADQIIFSRLDGDRLDYLHVRWHDVIDVAGALLEPTAWAPPLYRVRGYPDAGMLQRLRERAALP